MTEIGMTPLIKVSVAVPFLLRGRNHLKTGVSILCSVHLYCVVYMMISCAAFPLSEQYLIKIKEENTIQF